MDNWVFGYQSRFQCSGALYICLWLGSCSLSRNYPFLSLSLERNPMFLWAVDYTRFPNTQKQSWWQFCKKVICDVNLPNKVCKKVEPLHLWYISIPFCVHFTSLLFCPVTLCWHILTFLEKNWLRHTSSLLCVCANEAAMRALQLPCQPTKMLAAAASYTPTTSRQLYLAAGNYYTFRRQLH